MTKNTKALKHLLDREAFLKASRLRTKEVEIPDVGVVLIQELTANQRLQYMSYMEMDASGKPQFSLEKQINFNKFIVSLSVITDAITCSRMFASAQDVPDLRQDVMETLVKSILVLSNILTDDTPPLAETQKTTSDTP
jgi:hypothetical protein